jgi:hypothetical protein
MNLCCWIQDGCAEADVRKQKYNSLAEVDVSAEEMEAWRMKRSRADDPLTQIEAAKASGYDLV